MDEDHHVSSTSHDHPPTVLASTQGPPRAGRRAAPTASDSSESGDYPVSPKEQEELQPATKNSKKVFSLEEEKENKEEEKEKLEEEEAAEEKGKPAELEEESSSDQNRTKVSKASGQPPAPSEGPEPGPEQTPPHPNMVELLSDHRGSRECFMFRVPSVFT